MALADLSLVTEALTRLLAKYIQQRHSLGSGELLVTGDPPDLLSEAMRSWNVSDALSVYLYSIEEDGYHKNLPGPPGNSPPVQFQEMGLSLYYLLTAFRQTEDPIQRPFQTEQRLMGYAIKAFHDYSTIDANTQIINDTETDPDPDPYVFPDSLRTNDSQNEFRLALHPVALDELNKVWTGISHPMRLSAIYQVGVVMLEAEEPKAFPIPVLTPNIEVRPFQPIWIQATESDYRITLSGQRIERLVTSPVASIPVGGAFRVLGFGFGGAGVHVYLQSSFWSDPSYVEITDWIIAGTRSDQRMELQVADSVSERHIVPGSYQIYFQKGQDISNFATVNIAPIIGRFDSEGNPLLDNESNALPDIVPSSGPVTTLFSIYGGPFIIGGDIRSVEVFLGSNRLTPVAEEPSLPPPEPGPGQFRIVAGEPDRIEVMHPVITDSNVDYPIQVPVRIVVNGIGTPPARWLEVTA